MFEIPHLRAQTTELPHAPILTSLLRTEQGSIVWMREGKGFVAAGQAARYDHGPDGANTRFALASQWWTEVLAEAEIRDDMRGRLLRLVQALRQYPHNQRIGGGNVAVACKPLVKSAQ